MTKQWCKLCNRQYLKTCNTDFGVTEGRKVQRVPTGSFFMCSVYLPFQTARRTPQYRQNPLTILSFAEWLENK